MDISKILDLLNQKTNINKAIASLKGLNNVNFNLELSLLESNLPVIDKQIDELIDNIVVTDEELNDFIEEQIKSMSTLLKDNTVSGMEEYYLTKLVMFRLIRDKIKVYNQINNQHNDIEQYIDSEPIKNTDVVDKVVEQEKSNINNVTNVIISGVDVPIKDTDPDED